MITGSRQTRRGKYYAVVREPYGKEGKTRQRWIPTGITDTGRNKREGQRRVNEIISDLNKEAAKSKPSQLNYDDDCLFCEWIQRYLDHKKTAIRITSWEAYDEYTRLHILPYFTPLELTLANVTPQHIRDYFSSRRQWGLSTNSIKKHLAIIRGALQMAVDDGILTHNPGYRLRLPKNEPFESRYYTEKESNKLLSVIENDPLKPAIILGLFYGLRRSECLGLRWRDIDFDTNTIQIRNTVVVQKTLVEKEQVKSRSSRRTLFIIPETRAYLLELKRRQTENRLLLGSAYQVNDHICIWDDGTPFKPNYITSHFSLLLKKHGLPHIRFHELRHSCASLLLNRGLSAKQIQSYLGHEQISTTLDLYGHLSTESKMETARVIGETLKLVSSDI